MIEMKFPIYNKVKMFFQIEQIKYQIPPSKQRVITGDTKWLIIFVQNVVQK